MTPSRSPIGFLRFGWTLKKIFVNEFKEYRTESYLVSKAIFVASRGFVKKLEKVLRVNDNVFEDALLFVLFTLRCRFEIERATVSYSRSDQEIHSLALEIVMRQVQARHQASFLPWIEDPSKVKAQYQPSLHKTLSIPKDLAENSPIPEL